VSTSVLLGVVIFALLTRLYVRIFVQKEFSADDGFIIFGVSLLIVAMGLLYHYVDEMYLAEALLMHDRDVPLSFEVITESLDFGKWAEVSLILLWTAINAVKFSFLILFHKLINRIRFLTIYWWCVVAYTTFIYLYGISSYIIPCPNYDSLSASLYSHHPTHQINLLNLPVVSCS
jgi:hypothetical protein